MTPSGRRAPRAPDPEPGTPAPGALPDLPMASGGRAHPPFGLGLWALGRWGREDEGRTRGAVAHALDRGVRWFDTAEVYGAGRSERLLGDLLARATGAPAPFIGTKVSTEHLRPGQLRPALLGSLQRLGRPKVDLYLIHGPDPAVPLAATMAALEELQRENRFSALGVSNFNVAEMEEASRALASTQIAVDQVRYSLFAPEEGDEVLEYCRRHSIVVEAYSPLARGLLVGRYLDGEKPSAEVRAFTRGLFADRPLREFLRKARAIRALAAESRLPMESIALYWLVHRGCAPVVGVSSSAQVDRLLEAIVTVPPESVLDEAEAIAREGR